MDGDRDNQDDESGAVQGCYFHFGQAIYRKVAEHGLSNAYRDEPEFREATRFHRHFDNYTVMQYLRGIAHLILNPLRTLGCS